VVNAISKKTTKRYAALFQADALTVSRCHVLVHVCRCTSMSLRSCVAWAELWSLQRAGLREKPQLYCAWPQATLFTKPATRQLYNSADVCSSRFGACI